MYQYTKDPSEAEKIAKILMDEKAFGYDLETTGLDPHTDKVILASISTRQKTYLIDTRDPRCLQALRPPLENEKIAKIGFYLTFDYGMTKGDGGIDVEGCCDLRLSEQLLMAGTQWDGFSLEAVTKKYLNKERDKTLQKSFIGHQGEFSVPQLEYAAEDTSDLFPLADIMAGKITEAGLSKVWKIENQALAAFADIGFYGVKIDIPAWKKIMEDNWTQIQEAEKKLLGFYEPFFERDLFGHLDINFNSQQHVLYGLQKMGIKIDGDLIRNTTDATRKKVRDLPVIKALAEHREAMKAYGTYGQPYLDAIHAKTGRVHPRMDQLGTDNGRPNCLKPKVDNVPRPVEYRHAFITDEGRLISTVDYAGAELRIIADQSGDELMVRGFNSGVDFHCFVATMLFNRPEIISKKDPLRSPTKELNFGLAYGMGPPSLHEKLNGNGYKISMPECIDLFRKYKDTFKTAIGWLDGNKRKVRKDLVMVNIAGRWRHWTAPNVDKIQGQLRSELLKRRKKAELGIEDETRVNQLTFEKVRAQWGAIEREGANFPVQSTNVEWTKSAMYEIRKECKKRQYDARFYNSVYDETVLDVAKKDAVETHELQKKIMIECGQRYCSRVPVEVEGHLEPYWTK